MAARREAAKNPAMNETQTAIDFESLLAPVLERAYRYAVSLTRSPADAEDLVQESALQAFSAFAQFQRGTNFRSWYMRILTNCFLVRSRQKARAPQTVNLEDAEALYLNLQAQAAGIVADPEDPAGTVLGQLEPDQIADALASLPEEFSVVCALYFVQETSYQEIAEIVDCPVGSVRSRLHRGRRMLQRALWHVAEESGVISRRVAQQGNAS